MKSMNARRTLSVIVFLLFVAVLTLISQPTAGSRLPKRFAQDMQATQTAAYETSSALKITQDENSTQSSIVFLTASFNATLTATGNGNLITSTATIVTPTLDPLGIIEFFDGQTQTAQTTIVTSITDQGPLFVTPLGGPTSSPTVTARATRTPLEPYQEYTATSTLSSIRTTLTARSVWMTSQVKIIQSTAFPDLATAAANLMGTATAQVSPTPSPTPTESPLFSPAPTLPISPSTTNSPSKLLAKGVEQLFDTLGHVYLESSEVYIYWVWLLPGLVVAWMASKVKPKSASARWMNLDLPSLIIFYFAGVLLSVDNDFVGY